MGKTKPVQPVKLFVGMLSISPKILDLGKDILQKKFGPIDKESNLLPFSFTHYYDKEMGTPLLRKFLAFQQLIDPQFLKDIKLYTNDVELEFGQHYAPPVRSINLDPGYLSFSKVILATTKDYSHRLYLGDGIYGEVTLRYYRKKFCPCEWTYPDYQTPEYLCFFEELLALYREQLQ